MAAEAAAREPGPKGADVRWNLTMASIDAAGWGLGMGLVSHTTILPLFVNRLTDSDLAVGMIQAVMHFGWLVPGILVSSWVERLPRVKPSVMWIAAVERLMLLLMFPLCLWLGPRSPGGLLGAFFGCWLVMNCAMGANMPGYYKLIAKTIPPHLRGRLYGVGGAISGILGLGTAALAGWFLSRWGFPAAYAACFLAAFALQTVTVVPLGFMREPVQAPEDAPPHLGVRGTLGILKADPRMAWLIAGAVFYSLNQVAGAFFTLFSIQRFGVGEEMGGVFTAVVMGSKTLAFLLSGWLGDRFGNRVALAAAAVSGTAAAVLAWLAPDVAWIYPVFVLNEIAIQGWGVCASNYVLELCPPERAGSYTAVYGAVFGPFRVGLPLLGGALIAAVGFKLLFAISAAGGLAALGVILARLTEPRTRRMAGGGWV